MEILVKSTMVKMCKMFQCLSLVIFFSIFSFGQNNLQNECNMEMVGEEFQFIYEDSVQISVSFNNNVNLSNANCKEILLEGYSNYIPRTGISVICILTIDGGAMDKFDGVDYYRLFQCKKKQELIDHIISGYVYDMKTEKNEAFFGSDRVNSLLKLRLK